MIYSFQLDEIATPYAISKVSITRLGIFPVSAIMLFPQLQGKCQGITRQDGARPALFQNFCVVLCIVCFVSFYVLFVCKCVLY